MEKKPKKIPVTQRFFNAVQLMYGYLKNFGFNVLIVLFVIWGCGLVIKGFDWLNQFHWSCGLMGVLFMGFILWWQFPELKRRIQKYNPELPVWGTFSLMILWLALTLSEFSLILFRVGWAKYEPVNRMVLGELAAFYIWKFFDMLPGIKVWETLNVDAPLETKNWVAGMPVLIFQIITIVLIIKWFKEWMKARKKYLEEKNKP
jgi:hypothetical protein